MVELQLSKLVVVGSIPITRSDVLDLSGECPVISKYAAVAQR